MGGWLDVLRSPDPSRALYERLMANQTGRTAAAAIEGAMEGVGNLTRGATGVLGALGHAATVPTRAIAGAATNAAGTGAPVDVSDYALYGQDLETGRRALQYGDLLSGTLEDAGEVAPGGAASKLLSFLGNVITDPGMAPGMLTAAEGAGALAGSSSSRLAPAPPEVTFPRRPQSRLDPAFAAPEQPPAPAQAPPQRSPFMGSPYKPATVAPATEPGPGPTATQPVKTVNPADVTQPVKTLSEKQKAALARARHQGQRG